MSRRHLRTGMLSAGAVALIATTRPPGPSWVAEGSADGPRVQVSPATPMRFAIGWSTSAPPPECGPPPLLDVVVDWTVSRVGPDDPDDPDVVAWTDPGEEDVALASSWLDGPSPLEVEGELVLDAESDCGAEGCEGSTEIGLEALADTTFEVSWTVSVSARCEVGRKDDPPTPGDIVVVETASEVP